MLKDITLGQYFPGNTLAHRLDPRTKLLATVLYIVALFTAKSYLAYSSFSHSGLIHQLEYEGFTSEQAEYGVKAVGF